jgi:hypothetical protein
MVEKYVVFRNFAKYFSVVLSIFTKFYPRFCKLSKLSARLRCKIKIKAFGTSQKKIYKNLFRKFFGVIIQQKSPFGNKHRTLIALNFFALTESLRLQNKIQSTSPPLLPGQAGGGRGAGDGAEEVAGHCTVRSAGQRAAALRGLPEQEGPSAGPEGVTQRGSFFPHKRPADEPPHMSGSPRL